MSDRGDYRSLYVSFWDDEAVHALSDAAYRVLTTLRGTLPASGIGVVYASQLAERCGKTTDELEAALRELEAAKPGERRGWIMRDRHATSKYVVWLVNGLRFDPSLSSKNAKHLKYIRERHLAPLGMGSEIVRAFMAHYTDWFNVPRETSNDDSGNTIPESQDRVSQSSGSPALSNHHPVQPVPAQSGDDDDSADVLPTPVAIVRTVADARKERWGDVAEMHAVGMASATELSTSLCEKGIPMRVAYASIYRQCRGSKDTKPIGTATYFEPGIIQDWDREQARRASASAPKTERPPPAGDRRPASSAPRAPSAYANVFKPQ